MNTALEKNFEYFLKVPFQEYSEGEWIAIFNEKVISHGKSLNSVLEEAKKITKISNVLLTKVKKSAKYL